MKPAPCKMLKCVVVLQAHSSTCAFEAPSAGAGHTRDFKQTSPVGSFASALLVLTPSSWWPARHAHRLIGRRSAFIRRREYDDPLKSKESESLPRLLRRAPVALMGSSNASDDDDIDRLDSNSTRLVASQVLEMLDPEKPQIDLTQMLEGLDPDSTDAKRERVRQWISQQVSESVAESTAKYQAMEDKQAREARSSSKMVVPKPRKPADEASARNALESIRNFDLTPKQIVEYLNRYVAQQSDAKKALAVAICKHYNHCRRVLDDDTGEESMNYAKPNVLLAGPTGVGKTYLMKTIARLIGVPFVKADATKFTATGYVGRDVLDVVRDLVRAAGNDASVAQYGIVYIDEIDKVASAIEGGSQIGRGEVQYSLLKLLEETDVSLVNEALKSLPPEQRGPENDDPGEESINTRNILFIFSGAFTGLDAALRLQKDELFEAASEEELMASLKFTKSFLRYAKAADYIAAGLEPEFVGRLPVRVALDALDADGLKDVLARTENSILDQFIRDFAGFNIRMLVTDEAMTAIAKLAEEEGTGARGLVTILEGILREHMYQLPSENITSFVLNSATVNSPADGLAKLLNSKTAKAEPESDGDEKYETASAEPESDGDEGQFRLPGMGSLNFKFPNVPDFKEWD